MGNRILSPESYDAIEEYKDTSFIANMIIKDARRSAYGEHGYIMCSCSDNTLPDIDDEEFFRLVARASRRESSRDGTMRMKSFSANGFHVSMGMVVLYAKYGEDALDALLASDNHCMYTIMARCESTTYSEDTPYYNSISTGYAEIMNIFRRWRDNPKTRGFFDDVFTKQLISDDFDDMIYLWKTMNTSYPDINGIIMAYITLYKYHNSEKNNRLGLSIIHAFFLIFERFGVEIESGLACQSCSTLIHLYNVVKANNEENTKRALPEVSQDIIVSMQQAFDSMKEYSYEFGFEMMRDCI